MRLEINPRFANILRDGYLVDEIGKVPVRGVLEIDDAQITPETYRFIMLSPQLVIDGLDCDQRHGLPSQPWVQSVGDATHAFGPPTPQTQVIKASDPVKLGRVIN